jgi:hypothetical protein
MRKRHNFQLILFLEFIDQLPETPYGNSKRKKKDALNYTADRVKRQKIVVDNVEPLL